MKNVAASTSSSDDGESASNSTVASAGPATLAADQTVTSAPIATSARGPARPASADFAAGWYSAVPIPATSASARIAANEPAKASADEGAGSAGGRRRR